MTERTCYRCECVITGDEYDTDDLGYAHIVCSLQVSL